MTRVCACTGCDYCGERCPRLSDSTRCDGCRRVKRRREDKRRPNSRARGYTAEWQAFRARFIREHPICMSEEGCIALSEEVHHIDGKGPKGPRGFDPTNCQALCKPHHARLTAELQPGGFRA